MAGGNCDQQGPSPKKKGTYSGSRRVVSTPTSSPPSTSTAAHSKEAPKQRVVRFICRCGKMVRERDVEAVQRRRCPACGASFDAPSDEVNRDVHDESVVADQSKRPSKDLHPSDDAEQPETYGFLDPPRKAEQLGREAPKTFSSKRIPSRSAEDDPDATSEISEEEMDRALLVRTRPTYWRLIGRRPRIWDCYSGTWSALSWRFFADRLTVLDWYSATWSTISAAPFLLKVAVQLTVISGLILLGVSPTESALPMTRLLLTLMSVGLVAMPFVLGNVGNYLCMSFVLAAGRSRKPVAAASRSHVDRVLLYFSRWLLCLVAGPLWIFLGTYAYWLNCGALRAIDWFILVELLSIGAGYWFAAVLSVELDQRLLSANPLRVMQTVTRLGPRFLLYMAFGFAAVATPAAIMISAFAALPTNPIVGLALIAVAWVVALYLAAGVVQVLGTLYRASVKYDSNRNGASNTGQRSLHSTSPGHSAKREKHGTPLRNE